MLEFRNVTKTFRATNVLDNISFSITPGEFVSIIGPSGAGKTTLIHLLIGHHVPTDGEVIIDDVHINKLDFETRQLYRRKLGIVFQDYRLLPQKTVYENVAFAMEVCGETEAAIFERVPKVLDMVGLLGKQDSYPQELSGGEQQRTAIARALIHNPSLLIADEPTGNLDPVTSMDIIKLLEKINKEGTTIILTTHNERVVNHLQRRVIVLSEGKIVYDVPNGGYMYAKENA